MHWNQIKTLLILSFLALNVYLFFGFMEKKQEQDIGVLEQDESSIEEILRAESIKIKELPDTEYEETFITVAQRKFSEQELAVWKNQTAFLFNDYFIASKIDKPILVPDTLDKGVMNLLLEEIVYAPNEYEFWNWNEELNVLVFFQNKQKRPVYYNQNGLILVFLDDDNRISYYLQAMLGEAETLSERKQLIKPIRAIEILYGANELHSNDEIESINIGFHTRVPFESGEQVFAPIWKVNVNNETNYFVNAIEGFTFSTNEEEFLLETIDTSVQRIKSNRRDDKVIDSIVSDLEKRVEDLHKGELE